MQQLKDYHLIQINLHKKNKQKIKRVNNKQIKFCLLKEYLGNNRSMEP